VQGDDLVTEHVVARLEGGGDLDEPGVAVLGKDVTCPLSVLVASTADLEKTQGRLVDSLAVAIAVGKVVDDRADMAGRPLRCPRDGNLVSRCDGGMASAGSTANVADGVSLAEVVGLNETVVLVQGSPAEDLGRRARVVEVRSRIVVAVLHAIHDDVADMTVGCNKSSAGERGKEGVGFERHVGGWYNN